MRQIIFALTILFFNNASAQNYYMTSPEGFGAAATGGGNATPVTVTTYTALKNALTSTAPANAVILVSGTIDCIYTSVTLTNKTIIGLPGARLRNTQITIGDPITSGANSGILNIKSGSNNVIIRNLIFEGPGAYDVDGRDLLTSEGTTIWVDHCEFQDGMDGNFDIKGTADNTTISWCKFTYLKPAIPRNVSGFSNDHRFSNLVGSGKDDFPSDGHYSITFQNCYWADGCKERMPRARNAELHILNCYYYTNVASSLAIGLGGGNKNTTCYVENTDFAKITNVSSTSYIGSDGGTVGLAFSGCLNKANSISGTVSKPTYSYTVLPVANVASYVTNATCGAGATLSVNASGEISTTCPNLSIESNTKKVGYIYPTTVDNFLNIDLADNLSGELTINIFSVEGKNVFNQFKKVNPSEKLSFNVSYLPKGLYLCNLTSGETSTSLKFLKK
jgi:pectate lyase